MTPSKSTENISLLAPPDFTLKTELLVVKTAQLGRFQTHLQQAGESITEAGFEWIRNHPEIQVHEIPSWCLKTK